MPVDAPARDAATAESPNRTGLPDDLKRGIETLSGLSMDDVRVHRNSARPGAVGAYAYAQGSHIHVAPGQDHNLPHEAWHIVQQKQGRVSATMQLKGGVPVNDDVALEREADIMGARALASSLALGPVEADVSTRPLSLTAAAVIQRQLTPYANGTHSDTRNPGPNRQVFTRINNNNGNNAGLTGHYRDAQNREFHYDDATKLYRRTNGAAAGRHWDVANQRDMRRVTTAADANGRVLHRYEGGHQRHYYNPATRLFTAMPQRAHWIDTLGQFVDNTHNQNQPARRVLAPNGAGLDKQYAVTKSGRDYIVPFKRLNADFSAGLPALYGGNVDPHETANQAVTREVTEESGNRFALGANLGQLAQVQAARNPHIAGYQDLNRYTIRNATLNAPVGNPVARHEMAGEMRLTVSDFVGHTANPAATKTRLLDHLTHHVAGNLQHAQPWPIWVHRRTTTGPDRTR